MNKCSFDDIRKKNLLLYEYIRGSEAYGTSLSNLSEEDKKLNNLNAVSDIDTSGVFIAPLEQILGLGNDYQDSIADERNDNVWNELGKWFTLLCNSNPNILESLWIPQRCILYETDIIKEIKVNRDKFLSKKIYETFSGYARSQSKKMVGLNKAIVNPVKEHLSPLDFVYTFYEQGSTKINNWLEHRGLKQRYCGLVNIPNMHNMYGLYYDYMTHIEVEYGGREKFLKEIQDNWEVYENDLMRFKYGKVKAIDVEPKLLFFNSLEKWIGEDCFELHSNEVNQDFLDAYENKQCLGFRGIINVEENSNQLRLANVPFGELPLCQVSYNEFGYNKHCGDYKRWHTWLNNRNQDRYKLNLKQNYDLKNAYHMMRLINMSIEILNGDGVFIDRTDIDRDLLIDIRLGKIEYEDFMKMIDERSKLAEEAFKNSKLQENINTEEINDLLIFIRKKHYLQ